MMRVVALLVCVLSLGAPFAQAVDCVMHVPAPVHAHTAHMPHAMGAEAPVLTVAGCVDLNAALPGLTPPDVPAALPTETMTMARGPAMAPHVRWAPIARHDPGWDVLLWTGRRLT